MKITDIKRSVFDAISASAAFRWARYVAHPKRAGTIAACLLLAIFLINDAFAQSGLTNSGGPVDAIQTAISNLQASPGLLVMIVTAAGAIFSAALGNFSLSFLLAVIAVGAALVR